MVKMMNGSVTAVASAVARGRLQAVDAVSIALERIERLDADLAAVVALRSDQALREAAQHDRAVAERRVFPGKLFGVPALVKDSQDVADMPTRHGSVTHADSPPAQTDGQVSTLLRRSGAIIVGKTALPEFATEGFTASRLTGVTRNPWDKRYSPGGSSGGSAAAISAGMVPIATATDGGGSVRIPAAFCGLLGLKPTRGVISEATAPDWIDWSTDGPLATSAADLKLLFDVFVGREVRALGNARLQPGSEWTPPTELLVAYQTSPFGSLPVDVTEAFDSAVMQFSDALGSPVRWIDPEDLFPDTKSNDDWYAIACAEHVNRLGGDWVSENLAVMDPAAREFMTRGLQITLNDYIDARRRQIGYSHRLTEWLGSDRLLLTPTVAVSSILADGRLTEDSSPGSALDEAGYSTALQNMTGHPALTVPAGMSGPLPFGLQVTGPWYSDRWLIDIAAEWEKARPWRRVAPGYQEFPSEKLHF